MFASLTFERSSAVGRLRGHGTFADEVFRKEQFRLVDDDDVSRRPRDGF